jgi:hypothetical protein
MVRSEDWKLVEIYGSDEVEGGREGMLFDFRSDPGEENNLWNDPEYESVRQELREALLAWRIETGDQASKSFAERR